MIVIVGGGPAGAMAACRFRQRGEEVLVLEKAEFPRFRLGESLLPQSLLLLKELDLLERAKELFLIKRGAQFHDGEGKRSTRFDFDQAFDTRIKHALQVTREEFDMMLLDRARELGAEVRHGWNVLRARTENGRVVGVDAVDPAGNTHAIDAKFVIDATGRDALLAHESRTTEKLAGLENTAFYTHVTGMKREEGEREGDIHIVMFGQKNESSWFWVIPFKDGRTSLGAVATRAWVRARAASGDTPDTFLQHAIAESPKMQEMLAGTQQLWPARAAADYSYRVRTLHGPGWAAFGDAGGFIDPLFSTGVHLAMWGAHQGCDAILASLAGDARAMDAWEARVRQGAEMFLQAVNGFYAGALQKYMFTENPRAYLRRAITSLLSGDVFGDERYTRDMRERLGTIVAQSPQM